MKYITIKRYKRNDARGHFNIPYGTELEEKGGVLYHNGKDVCGDHSAVMREYFARHDDGCGLERGKLSQAIVRALRIRKGEAREERDKRWKVVWEDTLCLKYKKDMEDFWLWSIEFFNAPVKDLEYIAKLVGVKKGAMKNV